MDIIIPTDISPHGDGNQHDGLLMNVPAKQERGICTQHKTLEKTHWCGVMEPQPQQSRLQIVSNNTVSAFDLCKSTKYY